MPVSQLSAKWESLCGCEEEEPGRSGNRLRTGLKLGDDEFCLTLCVGADLSFQRGGLASTAENLSGNWCGGSGGVVGIIKYLSTVKASGCLVYPVACNVLNARSQLVRVPCKRGVPEGNPRQCGDRRGFGRVKFERLRASEICEARLKFAKGV